ncbi:prolipoprotein diacylglyceryl transferase [Corynebacterium cystitidis]|uniref:Phosphatidylglycerol--prolipoprotein diacylglyceryl transferase n=1 Tax=Corynebacterium cystitidis DSM 20524 TaxID=1121357 RepID=A0A1H9NVN1_9CORY|nr:prolipoprotein diacylglyceryl transferase [Corynebacterium cystitidis]WJY82724.1 Prolipoprotein diacylglyceryl transferase [Corynebacterium cystitidis DSM 20524]SER39649.1 prolipoprotein diacylglyceryl transferase [Corynebacterium cystitidis DSM 20524]SNV71335.1 prolipoprotein diacylglyceryl transferase [Corynebacterium cystitidis]
MQTTILANIPSPSQGVWELGPIPIRAYALFIVIGILVALWLTLRRYRAKGGDPDVVWDAAIVAVPAGIIGGRLYHVITDYDKYFGPGKNAWDAFNIAGGGLGIWGAVALGGVAVWILFRVKKLPLGPFADAVAPGIIVAQAIGRLGNWFNQELYGRPTDVPWALDIYYRVDESGNFAPLTGQSTGEVIASVHPTFLYELVWNLLVFVFLLWAERKWRLGHGRVFALYVVGYTLGRFWIELLRDDTANMILGLRVNTWVSAIVFIIALIVFFKLPRGQESPQQVDPRRNSVEKHERNDETSTEPVAQSGQAKDDASR